MTINPKNNDDKCFHYAIMAALNREQLRKDLHILTKISPFIGQHEREDMNFPSQAKD